MSSSTLHQSANLNDRRVRLLEARLSGNGNAGGGSSNTSTESTPLTLNLPPGTTYVPMMDLPFLLQNASPGTELPSQPIVSVPMELLVIPAVQPSAAGDAAVTVKMEPSDGSNVSVRSASSEHNSGGDAQNPETAAPSETTRNLSANSNSVSQMSVDPPVLPTLVPVQPVVDARKRKRGKNKELSTSPVTKPAKSVKSESAQHAASTVNGSVGATVNRRASDFYTKASLTGAPSPVGVPRSGSMSIPPAPGSRSPLHPATGLYAPPLPSQPAAPPNSVQFLPVTSSLGLNTLNGPAVTASGRGLALVTTATQTDLSLRDMQTLISKQSSDKADKEKTQQTFEQKISDMQKEIVKLKHKLDTSDSRLLKCIEMEKKLLSEKSAMEKKSARSKSVHNRMKLGQFVTEREGANFLEKFLDGYAFNELHKKMDELTAEKEELDRRRKLLLKRKPTDKTSKKNANSAVAASSGVQSSSDTDSQSATAIGAVSQPFASALVGVTNNAANGPAAANWATDFIQPEVREWTWSDYSQEDEILKLRTAQLKKDEQDCATELEKMERERLIHIRELKRIFNEDQSVFKNNPVLHGRYLLLTLIGKGGFSEVHKAFDIEEQRYVALKVHQLIKEWKDDKKANYIKHALREYHVHKHLTHPRVVRLFDVFEIDNNSFATVLEYVEGNDLDFYLKQQKTIPEREARIMISQVVSALKYFNELKPPIIHYDLKPGNILLGHANSSGEIKVTDFGLSKVCDDDHYDSEFGGMDLTSQGAGTYWYLPPEVFETSSTPKISSKVDVWSVGVIFYQMLYGKKPYGDKQSQREVLQNFTILNAREVEFPNKPQISLEAKNFIRRCLTLRKDDRPEVRQLVHDEYLQLGTKLTKGSSPAVAPSPTFSTAGPSSNHYGQ